MRKRSRCFADLSERMLCYELVHIQEEHDDKSNDDVLWSTITDVRFFTDDGAYTNWGVIPEEAPDCYSHEGYLATDAGTKIVPSDIDRIVVTLNFAYEGWEALDPEYNVTAVFHKEDFTLAYSEGVAGVREFGAPLGEFADPCVFRADSLLWLKEIQGELEQMECYFAYFSNRNQRPEHRNAYRLEDGESLDITLGFWVHDIGLDGLVSLEDLYLVAYENVITHLDLSGEVVGQP